MRCLGNSELSLAPLGLGTWAWGGTYWGGCDPIAAEATLCAAIEAGINLVDTAPSYGYGLAERIIGYTLNKHRLRSRVILATKCGLEWSADGHQVQRNLHPDFLARELTASLERLRTDYIDLYQIHWPDPNTPLELTLAALERFRQSGKIRAYGVSNFNRDQLKAALGFPIASQQPPLNVFETAALHELIPLARQQQVGTLAYGGLCRGLLSGAITARTEFSLGDLRRADPKLKADRRSHYLNAVHALQAVAQELATSLPALALAWVMHQDGVTAALVGARIPDHIQANAAALALKLSPEILTRMNSLVRQYVPSALGPDFFAPRA